MVLVTLYHTAKGDRYIIPISEVESARDEESACCGKIGLTVRHSHLELFGVK